ncbi:MAG TPA: uroporphyrinogen decarboxylase [Rhizomicrobium sp.]|nr:uroporphyrinogen decarboxylase [Rhizomicrobium sp.]
MKDNVKPFLAVLNGTDIWPPPVWLMRQAGRYLFEYRQLRAQAGSFWRLCMTPELAAEATLQPIRRFDFDAAILFSDILVVPFAMGSRVSFEDGGPKLSVLSAADDLEMNRSTWGERLAPVYAAIREVRERLDSRTALLGFAGAPWTLATYLAEGGGSSNQACAKLWGYRDPKGFAELLTLVAECVAFHLIEQLNAGADAVQLFDSWAGGLPDRCFDAWVIVPTKRIVEAVRLAVPDAKIIGFPRAASLQQYERYGAATGVSAVSLDTAAPISWASEALSPMAIQGNLDPLALVAGGEALGQAVDHILATTRGRRFIFNLGHGVLPETPPEHVSALVGRVRSAR